MKAKYFGVISFDAKGNTTHVDVFFDRQKAIDTAIETGGFLGIGIRRIINRCNWWNNSDSMNYRRNWVLANVV